MSASSESTFDIVFYGLTVGGTEREAALRSLSEMMRMTIDEVEEALATIDDSGRVIARALPEARARRHFESLQSIGARCLMRPARRAGQTLELVPISLEEHLECPTCKHDHVYQRGEEPPLQCLKCGLVFAKYDRVEAEKAERERIRQSLVARQQALGEGLSKDQQQREDMLRRQQIEEELRKELGIPKAVNSRGRLLATGVVILALGGALGVGSALLFDRREQVAVSDAPVGAEPAADPYAAAAVNPGLGAHMVLQQLESRLPPVTVAPAAIALPSPANVQFDNLRSGTDSDRQLLEQASTQLAGSDGPSADALINGLKERSEGVRRLSDRITGDARGAPTPEIKQSLAQLARVAAEAQGALAPSPRDVGYVARAQASVGLLPEAESALTTLQQMRDGASTSSAKVAAEGELGALFSTLNRGEEARSAFERANVELPKIGDRVERLETAIDLAQSYADSGQAGAGLLLIEDVRAAAPSVSPPEARLNLLRRLAVWHLRAGNVKAAEALSSAVEGAGPQSSFKLELVNIAIDELNIPAAAEIATHIDDPANRARALARVGLAETKSVRFRALAPSTFELVRGDVNLVTDPAEKVMLTAELGRIMQWSGDQAAASNYFSAASHGLQTLGDVPDRGVVIGVVAGNLGQAAHLEEANALLAQVDEKHAGLLRSDFQQALAPSGVVPADSTVPQSPSVPAPTSAQGASP